MVHCSCFLMIPPLWPTRKELFAPFICAIRYGSAPQLACSIERSIDPIHPSRFVNSNSIASATGRLAWCNSGSQCFSQNQTGPHLHILWRFLGPRDLISRLARFSVIHWRLEIIDGVESHNHYLWLMMIITAPRSGRTCRSKRLLLSLLSLSLLLLLLLLLLLIKLHLKEEAEDGYVCVKCSFEIITLQEGVVCLLASSTSQCRYISDRNRRIIGSFQRSFRAVSVRFQCGFSAVPVEHNLISLIANFCEAGDN